MYRLIAPLVFIFLFISCGQEVQQEVETISMEELMGDTGDASLQTDTLGLTDTISYDKSNLGSLILSFSSDYDTSSLSKGHPFDRYGFSSSKKIQFSGKKEVPYGKSTMVIPKADVFIYNFTDSIKLNNAFYNWLDCFGSDCNEIKLKEDVEAIKTPPSFTLVYDTTLVSVNYMCEHQQNDWKSFQDSILKKYGNNYRYRIDVSCGGPLVWK